MSEKTVVHVEHDGPFDFDQLVEGMHRRFKHPLFTASDRAAGVGFARSQRGGRTTYSVTFKRSRAHGQAIEAAHDVLLAAEQETARRHLIASMREPARRQVEGEPLGWPRARPVVDELVGKLWDLGTDEAHQHAVALLKLSRALDKRLIALIEANQSSSDSSDGSASTSSGGGTRLTEDEVDS